MTNPFSKILPIVCAIVMSASAYGQGFNRLIIFGDSLSDTGNLASATGHFPDPLYENSRVSNGPVAVEYLAAWAGLSAEPSLHLVGRSGGGNYAVADARARGSEVIDLTAQVGAFLLNNGGIAPADALYIMFIGGNDVRDARDLKKKQAEQVIDLAVTTIGHQLGTLIAAGARSIMVINSPNVGSVPETQQLAQENKRKKFIENTTKKAKQFNKKLALAVQSIEKASGIDIVQFDLFQLFDSIIADASGLGYINNRDACLNTDSFEFHPDCEFGANFNQFVFFDQFHASGHTHERAGRAFFAFLPAASAMAE